MTTELKIKKNGEDITVMENGETIIQLRFFKGDFGGGGYFKPLSALDAEKIIQEKKLLPENIKISFDHDHRFGGGIINRERSEEKIVKAIENEHLGFSSNGKITQSKVHFTDGTTGTWVLDNGSPYYRDRVEIPEELHTSFIGKSAKDLIDAGYKEI